MSTRSAWWRAGVTFLLCVVLLVLYGPLVPPFFLARSGPAGENAYTAIWSNPDLVAAAYNSVVLALVVALVTGPLALLAALAVRTFRWRRMLVLVMIMPLFVPAVSIGLAEALFFRMLGVSPSLLTMIVVQVIWALPFSFLIVLATMSTFDPVYLDAAYVHGARPLRAFRDIELPLIRPGVIGGAAFAAVLSLNETIRTSLVQGPFNTLQTYIWTNYLNVGISPSMYALMAILIMSTCALFLLLGAVLAFRGALRPARSRPAVRSTGQPVGKTPDGTAPRSSVAADNQDERKLAGR